MLKTKKRSIPVALNWLCKFFHTLDFDIYEILIGVWALRWIIFALVIYILALLAHEAHV